MLTGRTAWRNGPQRMLAGMILAGLCGMAGAVTPASAQTPWRFSGGDITNSNAVASPAGATQLNPTTAPNLHLKWTYTASGDISATPTVEPGGLYFTDWGQPGTGGSIYKLNPDTGHAIWKHKLSIYTQAPTSLSRTSPAIGALGELVFADAGWGATVIAINKSNGLGIWKRSIDDFRRAAIASAPVIYDGMIYIATSSAQETQLDIPPAFRGSIVALDEKTGRIVWHFRTVPLGYTGGASVGSNPSVWVAGNALLVTTDNNYSVPADVTTCLKSAGPEVQNQLNCMDPTNYVDSFLSLDLKTGKLNWARRVEGADTWNINCTKTPPTGCPDPAGHDDDFAQAPNLLAVPGFTGVVDDRLGVSNGLVLGAGQKSGTYWALNPANGGLFWSRNIGIGGIQWGSTINTVDGSAAYTALNNTGFKANQLVGTDGQTFTSKAGAWTKLDIKTGKILWQVPASGQDLQNKSLPGHAAGSLAFTNNVLFGGSSSGDMAALDAGTGALLWKYSTPGTVILHPAIYNDTLFWGGGYARRGVGDPTLYAFSLQP